MDTTNIVKYINKAEKYVYKIRYILEFIFSIIAIFGIYKLITVKHYYGYYHKSYLLISIIYGILVLANIIYNCYKDNKIVEKMFLTFAIPVGIMYLVFMMPAYVPDETSHMWKSYEVSTGNMIPEKKEKGSTLIDVPKELLRYNVGKTSKYIELIGLPSEKTDYQDTEKTDSSAQGYSFILYIASSLGFLISRTFQLNILIGIYLGKIFNFIVFLIGGYYAIKKIPFGKLLILAYLFIPMVMHQAVSFSADCITNISVILFVAYVLSLIFQKEKTTRKQQVLLCALSILVGIVKVVYIPIIGLVLLLIFKKNMTKKEKSIVIPACIILGTIAAIMMYISSVQFTSDGMKMHAEQSNINSSEQIRYIISNPIKATKIIAKDLYYNLEIYINMLIGSNLGWLNIGINRSVIDAFLICVLLAIIVEKNKKVLNKKQKLLMLFLGISTILIIELAMYISWSSVGSTKLEGIQGRYFIPVAILMLLPMCMKNNYVKFKNINVKLPAIVSVLSVFVIQIIYCFFV